MKTTITSILLFFSISISSFGQNHKDSLIVFVGKKINLKYSPQEKKEKIGIRVKGKDTVHVKQYSLSMDHKYIAKYKIVQLLSGSYSNDTIEFEVFDHYGEPSFANFETVLLFVSKHNGKLYHEKYQYFDVYLTKNGIWASPYSSSDYNHSFSSNITVKPETMSFKKEVSYPVDKLTKEEVEMRYPTPYYEIKNGKAIAKYGNNVNDLFILKQQTILKARGIF